MKCRAYVRNGLEMQIHEVKSNVTVSGPLFSEPVQVIIAVQMGASVKLVGKGLRTGRVYEPILSPEQLAVLTASPATEPFDGDAHKFRLGIEACASVSPTSTTPILRCLLLGSIHCRINWKPFTTTS